MIQRALTIEEICRKLKPLFGDKIDQIYFRYSVAESREEKDDIAHFINALYQKNLSKLLDKTFLLEPPRKEEVSGDYPLASVSYAKKKLHGFSLREFDWPRHVCITGMSGSGKTTLAFRILENFIEKGKPFMVFDWKKSFRPLLNLNSNIMCITIGNDKVSNFFKTNINQPPKGIPPKEWITILVDLLAESFQVSFGVHKILLETLDELFEGWGVYEGHRNYPTWKHIKKALEIKAKESKGREATWIESALRIATILTFGGFGEVVNYEGKKEIFVEDLFDKQVIFELNSLGAVEKKFFCEFILMYVMKYKKANQDNYNSNFDHAILVDEAHNIFLKSPTYFVKESVTDMIYREMREYGVGLICLDQHISKISDTVKGNSACHIAFQQQLPQDIQDISRIMQLQDDAEMFSHLPVGSAVVRLSERYTKPFLIEVELSELRNKGLADDKIKSRSDAVLSGIDVERNDSEFKEDIIASVSNDEENNLVCAAPPASAPLPMLPSPQKLNENLFHLDNNSFSNTSGIPLGVKGLTFVREEKKVESKECEEEVEEMEVVESEISRASEKKFIIQTPEFSEISPITPGKPHFTEIQKKLFLFVEGLIKEGFSILYIERLLVKGLSERAYSESDVLRVVNFVLESELKTKKKELKKVSVYIPKGLKLPEDLDENQKVFIHWIVTNPNHQNSTVELYRRMGFSPRKGNKIKESLLERKLIIIEEERTSRGWKKYIRLAPHIHQSLTPSSANAQ